MIYAIIAFIVILVFLLWVIMLFAITLLELIINLPLLWAVTLRSYTEIKKEKKHAYYFLALLMTTLIFIFFTNTLFNFASKTHIWWITSFLIFIFIIAQLIMLVEKHSGKLKKLKKSLFHGKF